jgi:hypothetical protein
MNRDPFLVNPYQGTRQDGKRRHDQSWAELSNLADELDAELRGMGGILNAALLGAIAWAIFGGVLVILWGLMS